MTTPVPRSSGATTTLARPVWSTGRLRVFGIYVIVLNLVLLYLLASVWPARIVNGVPSFSPILVFSAAFNPGIEIRYLMIAMLAGALGSYIHLATSFADYVGNRQLYQSWTWWYLLRPFIGMSLAVLVYFVVRGGMLAGGAGAEQLSPYGIGAVSGLSGMFSKQTTDKLRELFDNFFSLRVPPQRDDPLRPESKDG